MLAAALLRPCAIPLVSEKMFEGCQQERAELAALAPGVLQIIPLQQPDEEALCQVFRLRRGEASSPQIGINRRPVGAAQFRQSLLCVRRRTLSGGKHQAPLRWVEGARRRTVSFLI